jgi:hypothetical protein
VSLSTSLNNHLMAVGFSDSSTRVFSLSDSKVSHLVTDSFTNGRRWPCSFSITGSAPALALLYEP